MIHGHEKHANAYYPGRITLVRLGALGGHVRIGGAGIFQVGRASFEEKAVWRQFG